MRARPRVRLRVGIDTAIAKELINNYTKDIKEYLDECIKNVEYEFRKLTMATKIILNKNCIWFPPINASYKTINLHSWFTIQENKMNEEYILDDQFEYDLIEPDDVKFVGKKIILNLTTEQKNIIDNWLDSYCKMYNYTLDYIKKHVNEKKILDFHTTRKKVKAQRDMYVQQSDIKIHDIDFAIKLACQNYKSAFTNFERGYIKKFRIRFWRENRKIKIIDLEKTNFESGSIRKKILGKVIGYYNGTEFDFKKIKSDCRLRKVNGTYYLHIADTPTKTIKCSKRENHITIDPGIRTFGTGITDSKAVKIGDNCGEKIKNYLKRLDKIVGNGKIDKEIKKKNRKMINGKIKNLVKEMHWQTIDYLIKNYDNVLIGNMSIKSIVNNKTSVLTKMTKRIGLALSFYKFKERLKYKCHLNETGVGLIDEWMTSKMCSYCGKIKDNLGGAKKYKCDGCGMKIDRDINGARNIYIKAIK